MEINQGYAIRRVIAFDNECGFVLGENPKAPDSYVTWQFNMRDGERNYFWGITATMQDWLSLTLKIAPRTTSGAIM